MPGIDPVAQVEQVEQTLERDRLRRDFVPPSPRLRRAAMTAISYRSYHQYAGSHAARTADQ
jgi:hypothetical protein